MSPSHSNNEIRIVIADDHLIVREGLRGMLNGLPDFAVVGEAGNGQAAVELCKLYQPHIILIDLEMPKLNGIGAIRQLAASELAVRPLVLTTYDSDHDIAEAMAAGAWGYLLKDIPRADLFAAIRKVVAGERLLPKRRDAAVAADIVSEREIEVLNLLADGLSNEAIGAALHISKATVKTHLIRIYRKLDVDDRTAAVTSAIRRKIIRLD